MVSEKLFREDLFYRLNVINLKIPSLKERQEDIPLLVSHFLKDTNKTLSEEALKKLINYSWPGNIRELENEIKKLVVLSGSKTILPEKLLKPEILDKRNSANFVSLNQEDCNLKKAIENLEKNSYFKNT